MAESPEMPAMAEVAPVVDWTEVTLTHRCNMRCFFCYEEARGNAEQPAIEDVQQLLDRTSEHSEQVVLCGREVLLREDVLDIIRYGSSIGLRVIVFTNGQQLRHAGMVESLVDAGCAGIAVSFHFPDAETYARGARVAAKCFDWTVKGLENVRDWNLANPDRPLAISTESDMFALNVDRLQEMRETLVGALRGAPWRMRLASLLPCKTYDIGLEHVLDPLDSRREEIAEFAETMPDDVPLGFVKVPLCILPEGREHRSLDAQYVYEGVEMTFNHMEADHIELDTLSVSAGRDIVKVMRTQPYRWVCRSCSIAPLCRFERCDWTVDLFHPTIDQRPVPYRPEGSAPSPLDALELPKRTASLADVLAGLGGDPERVRAVQVITDVLARAPFPEEDILRQLVDPTEDGPSVVDAWSEDDAVLAVVFAVGDERVTLRLGVPGEARRNKPLGLPIGYLDVAPLRCEPTEDALRACLARVQAVMLPAVDRWEEDVWFSPLDAWLLQDICEHLGESIWPGLGGIGEWEITEISLSEGPSLELLVSHPSGLAGGFAYTLIRGETESGAPGRIVLEVVITPTAEGERVDAEPCRPLLEALGTALTGSAEGADAAAAFVDRSGALIARFDGGQWRSGRNARGGGSGGAVDALRVQITKKGDASPRYCFFLAAHDPDRAAFQKVGDVELWYNHDDMDADAKACVDAIRLVMRPLQTLPPTPDTADFWGGALAKAAAHTGLDQGYDWDVGWG